MAIVARWLGTAGVSAAVLAGCSSEVGRAPDERGGVIAPAPPVEPAAKPQDEAIRNVREIAEAARVVYERTGSLCGPATPVPNGPPPTGVSFAPSDEDWTKFSSEGMGWPCLGWRASQTALRYKLYYFVGTGGPAMVAGGPDPTAAGFEATAVGDLNGDGAIFSKFSVSGTINPESKALSLSELWSYEPNE